MSKTVCCRLSLVACLAALASAAAQGQAGSLSGSIDRGNARSSSSSAGLGMAGEDDAWLDEDAGAPVYVVEGGRIIRGHRPPYPRPHPDTIGKRLPPGLGLGIGSNIGSDIGGSAGIGAGIGADTRALNESSRRDVSRQPSLGPRPAFGPRPRPTLRPYEPDRDGAE